MRVAHGQVHLHPTERCPPDKYGVRRAIPVLAGSVDLVLKDKNGRLHIVDFKRTKPSKGLLGKRKTDGKACDYEAYSAQLYAYKAILEGMGFKVASCVLLEMHEERVPWDAPHFVEAADASDAVAAMLEDLEAKALTEAPAIEWKKTTPPFNWGAIFGTCVRWFVSRRPDGRFVVRDVEELDEKGHPRVEFVDELDRPKALELSECVHGGGERSLLVDTEALSREGDFAVFSKLLAAVRDNGTHP